VLKWNTKIPLVQEIITIHKYNNLKSTENFQHFTVMNVNGTKSIAIHYFYKYSIKVITIHNIKKSP